MLQSARLAAFRKLTKVYSAPGKVRFGPKALHLALLGLALFANIFGNEAIRTDAAIPAFGLDRLGLLAELALYNFC